MNTYLTLADIEDAVVHEQYHIFPGTTVTVCCLTLRNGYNSIGESACVDPSKFDEGIGRKIARENALDGVWKLEGYLLKQRMTERSEG